MGDRILKFLREIENQLSRDAKGTGHKTPQAGLVSVQTEGCDYFAGLRELKDQIINSIQSHTPWHVLTLPDAVPLWKLLAFSRDSATFLQPEYLLQRYRELNQVLERQDTSSINHDYAQGIWENKDLEDWITTDGSSMIFLESELPFNLRLERFLLELIDHLSEYHPVVHILDLPQIPEFGALGAPTPQAVLEQLTTHVLQFALPQMPLQHIVGTLIRFKELQTPQDWFDFLLQSCKTIPRITILLDMRILHVRSHSEGVHSWPSTFAEIISKLTSTSQCYLKLMFVMSSIQSFNFPENISGFSVRGPDGVAYWSSPFSTLSVPGQMKPHPKPPPTSPWSPTEVIKSIYTPYTENDAAKSHLGRAANNHDQSVWKTGLEQRPISESMHSEGKPFAPPKTSDDIKIAILCALTLEADAVEALFDRHWDDVDKSELKAPGDRNSYSFGVLGGHKVVLAYMPSMGKASGAMVASHCSGSFRKLELTLLVGICGGVPFYTLNVTHELILGDVIVGEEIVVHDFGRQYPEGLARKKGTRDIPRRLPSEVRSLLSRLKGTRHMERLKRRTYGHLRSLMDEHSSLVRYPGAERDWLFEKTYRHKHHEPNSCVVCSDYRDRDYFCDRARETACEKLGCDKSRTVQRERLRQSVGNLMLPQSIQSSPAIHFGSIASGDQVMKSGEDRDRIAISENIIAFEMEAAGVWDVVSCCLVIKGVCDYADSHKNKEWQKYAAATAAACTKAFLLEWSTFS